ncbi:MAG: WGR domain-containing protein, partial [Proteobacteria bacterium]|nr:WGR domain-containing protein [Pseudomonadota bacterium]
MRFENASTNRFWESERQGRVLTTRYGAIGGRVQERAREYDSEDGAARDHERLIATRLTDGYRRVELDPALMGELEHRLAHFPTDAEAVLVFADLLLRQGDPRGELIALQQRIAHATSPEEVGPLDARLIELMEEHWRYLFGKPGGYPFEREFKGRRYIWYDSVDVQRLRGKAGLPMYKRIRRFLETCTDSLGPVEVVYGRIVDFEIVNKLNRILGWPVNPERSKPCHREVEEVLAQAVQPMNIELTYRFKFTFPESDVLLPYQHPAYYGGG